MLLIQALVLICTLVSSATPSPSILPVPKSQQQRLLSLIKHKESYQKGEYKLLEQNDTLCNTGHQGKQWSGTVDVTDDKRLFFCE